MNKLIAIILFLALFTGCTPLEPKVNSQAVESTAASTTAETTFVQVEEQAVFADKEQVMGALKSLAGKKILLGQYLSSRGSADLEQVKEITGKEPAILIASDISQLDFLKDWSQAGGIPGLVWYWEAPGGGLYKSGSGHKPATEFHKELQTLRNRLPERRLETMAAADWPDAPELVLQIDELAKALAPFKNQGFLFRPLPQGAGGWYWWSDPDDYSWLWKLVKLRLEEYHGLKNLIWVWNGMGEDWYQSDCDMASGDFYGLGAGDDPYLDLYQVTDGKKLLAASEMESPLTANALEQLKDGRRLWSWYGLWNPSYLYDSSNPEEILPVGGKSLLEAYESPLAMDLTQWQETIS